jgi:hypothetical protein
MDLVKIEESENRLREKMVKRYEGILQYLILSIGEASREFAKKHRKRSGTKDSIHEI